MVALQEKSEDRLLKSFLSILILVIFFNLCSLILSN